MLNVRSLVAAGALIALGAAPGFAQSLGRGVKVGLNLSQIRGDEASVRTFRSDTLALASVLTEKKSKTTFLVGGYLEYAWTDSFSLRPELLLTQKGGKLRDAVRGDALVADISLTYLELPLLVMASIPSEASLSPFVFVGPSLALKLNSDVTVDATADGVPLDASIDAKTFDIGIVLGGGVKYDRWSGDVRYTLGLGNAFESAGTEAKNGALSLAVGFAF